MKELPVFTNSVGFNSTVHPKKSPYTESGFTFMEAIVDADITEELS